MPILSSVCNNNISLYYNIESSVRISVYNIIIIRRNGFGTYSRMSVQYSILYYTIAVWVAIKWHTDICMYGLLDGPSSIDVSDKHTRSCARICVLQSIIMYNKYTSIGDLFFIFIVIFTYTRIIFFLLFAVVI